MANDTLLIQVLDSASHTVSATFTIPINPAPLTITTASPLPAGKQATAYSQPIRATGGVLPYTWSLVSQTGSNGWTVTSTGFVTGTPANAETDSLTIKVTDAASNSMQAVFSLTVTANVIYVPPSITTSSPLPNATVGTAYNFGMSVINGTSPFTWVITSGALPAGLSFASNGIFSGTPTTPGTVTLGIKVTDSHPTTAGPQNFSLTVNAAVAGSVKWNPGFYVMTRNDGQQSASFAAAASTPKVVGVAGWYNWDGIENNTLGVYSWTQLFNDFLALQSAFPGAFFVPMLNWFFIGGPSHAGMGTYNPQGGGIPKYILNGGAGTYGAGPAGNAFSGWYPDSYNTGTGNYAFQHANLCNANVVNRLIALYQNFATQIVPNIPGAPQYNGLTVDQHPLFTGIGTSTPTDINMINSLDIPANYTFAAQNTGYQALTAIQQYYKQTVCFLQPGFGGNSFSGSNDPTAQNALLLAMFNAGMGTSATDVTVATPASLSYGQNYFIGNNFNGATGFQPTYVNRMGAMFTSQGHDYGINGGNAPSDASVSTLINTAINTLGCGYYFMESYAQWNFTGAPAFQVQPFWNNYVKPAIASAPAINTTVPANIRGTTPIWTNFAAGGDAALSYENFRIFKNAAREGRMASGTVSATTGWPNSDFSFVVWEGVTIPSWAQAATISTPFTCGFIGTGSETITASGCTIGSIVHGSGGNYTTFSLYNVTGTMIFTVTGTTGGVTNLFAFMPEYPGSVIENPLLPSAFRTEAITVYSTFAGLRFMWWSNVAYNTGLNTSSTRNVGGASGNTQFANGKNGWGNGNQGQTTNPAEGYPVEWAAAFVAACNIGIYYNLPIKEDGTNAAAGTYTNAVLNVINNVVIPTGRPVRLEIGNELVWNGGYPIGATLQTLGASFGFPNTFDGAFQYLGYKLHALANACRSIFGAKFGTQVKIVFASQTSSSGWNNFFPTALSYMQTNYGAPSADLGFLSIAPYANLANNAGDTSVALVLSDLTTVSTSQAYNSGSESASIVAGHYGLKLAAYESGWQVNSEPSGNGFISSAIMNSGMTAAMQTYFNAMLDSGYQEICNFDGGASSASPGAGPYPPEDELTNNDGTLATTGSPRLTALQSYALSPHAPARNSIGPGGVLTSFADKVSNNNAFNNFNTPIQPDSPAIQFYWTGSTSTRSIVINVSASCTASIEIGGVIVATNVALASGNNTVNNIPVVAGFNYFSFQHATAQAAVINSITVN